MEINGKPAKMEQVIQNLPSSTQGFTESRNDSISIYNMGGLATISPHTEMSCAARLKKAFPQVSVGFYDVLHDRLVDNGFTDERLLDAVTYLIDNFRYPVPTIADIISFDKRLKLYDYPAMLEKIDQGDSFANYTKVVVRGNTYWTSNTERAQLNLK